MCLFWYLYNFLKAFVQSEMLKNNITFLTFTFRGFLVHAQTRARSQGLFPSSLCVSNVT